MQIRIKGLLLFVLAVIIAFSIAMISYMLSRDLIMGIIFVVLDVALLLAPSYYVFFLINEYFTQKDDRVNIVSDSVRECSLNSISKLKNAKDIKKIGDALEDLYERNERTKKLNSVLNEILLGAATNPRTDEFLESVMDITMDITESSMTAFYTANKLLGKLELKASRGFGNSVYSQFDISISEGFFGRSVLDGKVKVIENIPNDTVFTVKTFLGDITPQSVMIVPVSDEEELIGVLVLVSVTGFTKEHIETLEKISGYIAYAIKNGAYHEKNERLNNELKFQNQLIQNLNEDLEGKIRNRTAFLNAIFDCIKDTAIISLDKDNNITLFSKGAELLFESKEDDVIGRNILTVAENVSLLKEKLDKSLFTATNKGSSSEIYEVELMADKKYKLGVDMFALKSDTEKSDGVVVVIRNLSDLAKIEDEERAEEMLANVLVDESHVSLVLTDELGEIIRMNKNTEYLLDISKDNKKGNIAGFFSDKKKVANLIDYCVTTKERVEVEVQLDNGMQTAISAIPISSGKGIVKKVLLYLH